jgi:hypothetical protein
MLVSIVAKVAKGYSSVLLAGNFVSSDQVIAPNPQLDQPIFISTIAVEGGWFTSK